MVKHWQQYAQKAKTDWYDLSVPNCLGFMEFMRETLHFTFSAVNRSKNFVLSLRNFTGYPFSKADKMILDKYMSASFNTNPPKIKCTVCTWDINILLDHFVKMGPNMAIKRINDLAGKLVLQLLLTQACRAGEIAQLQLSTMQLIPGGVQFYLNKPTKTFTATTYKNTSKLQLMSVKEFRPNILLCPVATLLAYIDRTKHKRDNVDELFILMTTQEARKAAPGTIVRWAKDIMTSAGLGEFKVHSNRSATSTAALLLGMPLDMIVSKVGWLRSSTFTRHYLKPVTGTSHKKESRPKGKTTANTVHPLDRHQFSSVLQDRTPRNNNFVDVSRLQGSLKTQVYAPIASPSPQQSMHEVQSVLPSADPLNLQSNEIITSLEHSPISSPALTVDDENCLTNQIIQDVVTGDPNSPLPELEPADLVTLDISEVFDEAASHVNKSSDDREIISEAMSNYKRKLENKAPSPAPPAADIATILAQVQSAKRGTPIEQINSVKVKQAPQVTQSTTFVANKSSNTKYIGGNFAAAKLPDIDPKAPKLTKSGKIDKRTLRKSKMVEKTKLMAEQNKDCEIIEDRLESVLYAGCVKSKKRKYNQGLAYLKHLNEQAAFGNMIADATNDNHITDTLRKSTDPDCMIIGDNIEDNYRFTIPQNPRPRDVPILLPSEIAERKLETSAPQCNQNTMSSLRALLSLKPKSQKE